jgi:hypothetical protein
MKKGYYILGLLMVVMLCGCDGDQEDAVPRGFSEIQLNPDVIWIINGSNPGGTRIINGSNPGGTRLDALLNDSIKVAVTIDYGVPTHGAIAFVPDEGWFYQPDVDFTGTDEIVYTVCYENKCKSATITLRVEPMPDPNDCTFQLSGEFVATKKNTPIEIRIFENDQLCGMTGLTINSPTKGTFYTYSYSGPVKNTVYVYYPPKNFTGSDEFSYRVYTEEGYYEEGCNISITE